MATRPTPADAVPEFIVERFADHSPEELRAIAGYAETMANSGDVPRYVVQAFAIQDEKTRAAVAIYAADLAEYLEERENADDEEDRSPPGRMGGTFFG